VAHDCTGDRVQPRRTCDADAGRITPIRMAGTATGAEHVIDCGRHLRDAWLAGLSRCVTPVVPVRWGAFFWLSDDEDTARRWEATGSARPATAGVRR
jgi:hypothetical protein